MANYPWEKSYPPGVKWELEVPNKTIHQIFDESCAQYGSRPFTDFLDKVMSFQEYKDASVKAAAGFQKLGVKPGVNVGLYLPNTPHYLIAFFGVLKAGGKVVNYSPLDAARELEFKIGDSETDIVVTLDVAALYPKMAAMRGKTRLKKLIVGSIADYLPWPKNWLYPIAKKKELSAWPRDDWHMSFKDLLVNDGKYTPHKPANENLWDEVALLQYTGGTTGLPKAAMLTHGCIMAAMSQGQAWTTPYTTPGTEKVVCVLPLFHIYALSGIMLGAVRNGNQLILYPRPDIDMIVHDLGKKNPTFLPGVPTLAVVPMLRELSRMAYLWQVPHELDGRRLAALCGPMPTTAVDQALRVRRGQAVAGADEQRQQLGGGRAVPRRVLAQGAADDSLHRDVDDVLAGAGLVDGEHAGVADPGQRARLLQQPGLVAVGRQEQLDGDAAIEPLVARLVDRAHAAGAQERAEHEGAEPGADRERGQRGQRRHARGAGGGPGRARRGEGAGAAVVADIEVIADGVAVRRRQAVLDEGSQLGGAAAGEGRGGHGRSGSSCRAR